VRRNLVFLLGISKFEAPGFDPKFDLLPRSFEELLKCFESFRESQMQLPGDIDPFDKAARIPWPVIKALFKDKELGERFEAILNEYYAKENPAMLGALILTERQPKNLTGANRTFIQKLDKRWFRQARQLNKARNLAAHSMNDMKVASAFGISGKNPILQVRRKCLTLLASLVGIKKPA
jgi:hypothetical protein